MIKSDLKNFRHEYNFRPKKRLGQNFMVDSNILEKFAGFAKLTHEDVVIEIGAGFGNLTKLLCQKANVVFAIELDKALCKAASEFLSGYENLQVIWADFLKISIQDLLMRTGKVKAKVLGNLPYYISSPLIFHLLDQRDFIDTILITLQREVAKRLVASPGTKDYGTISCAAQYYTKPFFLMDVGRQAFSPQPRVDSALVKLEVLEIPSVSVKDEDLFFKLIRASFNQRRKTISNALSSKSGIGLAKKTICSSLERAGIDPMRRGETLSLEEFARLTGHLFSK